MLRLVKAVVTATPQDGTEPCQIGFEPQVSTLCTHFFGWVQDPRTRFRRENTVKVYVTANTFVSSLFTGCWIFFGQRQKTDINLYSPFFMQGSEKKKIFFKNERCDPVEEP